MVQPPVKHVVQSNLLGTGNANNQTITIAVGTLNPDPYTNTTNIKNANKIYAVAIQLDWNNAAGGAIGDYILDWYIGFNINGGQSMPVPGSIGASHISNQVFIQDGAIKTQGATTASNIPSVWRTILKLPKSWQTFNEGDELQFKYTISGPAGGLHDLKWAFIYKEFYP